MEILAPGSRVLLMDSIEALVICASIRVGKVEYQITWLDGNTRQTAWVEGFEVAPKKETETVKIGFTGTR